MISFLDRAGSSTLCGGIHGDVWRRHHALRFSSLEEKEIYLLLREIPGTGSKKALEYLDKISKSAPDFRRAILEGDSRALVSLFGFTKKTAEKMIVALKDRWPGLRLAGREKWSGAVKSHRRDGSHRRVRQSGLS